MYSGVSNMLGETIQYARIFSISERCVSLYEFLLLKIY